MKYVPLWMFGIVSGFVIGAAFVAKPGPENAAIIISAILCCAFWIVVAIYAIHFKKL